MIKRSINLLIILFFLICSIKGIGQAENDNSWNSQPEIILSGFADVFFVNDFNQPKGTQRQAFLFNHNRHNEFNLNLGLLQWKLNHTKYRASFALQTGTYANDNYAAEPGLLKNIFEANIGLSLNSKNNLWLDAGVMPSHIGFESAISMENMTLTRSLLAENSPYFLTGAKLTYSPTTQWEFAALVVNGWQRIQRLEGNSQLSLGTQVNYRPTANFSINWSTFIGTDDPDASRRMRYFNNLYGQFQVSEKFKFIAGFDVGAQQRTKGSSRYDFWLSPVFIGQLALTEKWTTAFRAEYYQDETGIIIPTNSPKGFQTTGFSLNLDYAPSQPVLCRIEGRLLNSEDRIFETANSTSHSNFIIAASVAIQFEALLAN